MHQNDNPCIIIKNPLKQWGSFKDANIANTFRSALKRYNYLKWLLEMNSTDIDSDINSSELSPARSNAILYVILNRIEKLKKWLFQQGEYPESKKYICRHIIEIPADKIRLLLKKELNFERIHAKSYVFTEKEAFIYWKNDMTFWDKINYSAGFKQIELQLLELKKGVTHYSINFPWIYSEPDFVATVLEAGNKFLAIIKLVVTNDPKCFSESLYKHETEIQVTLDCFGVNTCFLITLFYDKENFKKAIKLKVERVQRSFKLISEFPLFLRSYALFLADIIYELTGNSLPQESIMMKLSAFMNNKNILNFQNLDALLERPTHMENTQCEYEILIDILKSKKVGRIRKKSQKL